MPQRRKTRSAKNLASPKKKAAVKPPSPEDIASTPEDIVSSPEKIDLPPSPEKLPSSPEQQPESPVKSPIVHKRILPPPMRVIHGRKPTPNKAIARSKTPKKRKINVLPFPFSPQEEADLAEWYKENPCFYMKRSDKYRNTQLKSRILDEKASEYRDPEGMICTPEQLKNWMESMRSIYGKLTKEKSGAGVVAEPTEREKWIRDSFTFLAEHIVRLKGRTACKLKSKFDDNEPDDEELASSGPDPDMDETGETAPIRNKKKRFDGKTAIDPDFQLVEKICSTFIKTAAPEPGPSVPAELSNFGKDMASSMSRIPEERWNDVKFDIMAVMKKYSVPSQPPGLANQAKRVQQSNPVMRSASPLPSTSTMQSWSHHQLPRAVSHSELQSSSDGQMYPQYTSLLNVRSEQINRRATTSESGYAGSDGIFDYSQSSQDMNFQ